MISRAADVFLVFVWVGVAAVDLSKSVVASAQGGHGWSVVAPMLFFMFDAALASYFIAKLTEPRA